MWTFFFSFLVWYFKIIGFILNILIALLSHQIILRSLTKFLLRIQPLDEFTKSEMEKQIKERESKYSKTDSRPTPLFTLFINFVF